MVAKIILLTACSLLIVIVGMPYIEQGRTEARSVRAFNLAKQIKAGTLPAETRDPWGNSFDVRTFSGETIVTSAGANMVTPKTGYDSDDVSTSMITPPHKRVIARKQRQVRVTLGLAACPWLVWLAFAIRGRVRL